MTPSAANWFGGAFRALRVVTSEGRRRLFLLSLAGVIAYQLFVLSPFLAAGSLPNYFEVHDAGGAILETLRLRPPLADLWALVTDQPVYELGVQDRFGFISLQFVATPHSLFTMLFLPPLVALSLLLLARTWTVLRRGSSMAVGVAGFSASTVASLFGASTSAVACCGASSGPVFLSLLGFGFGSAAVIVDHAEVLELSGYALLLANILGLAGWLGRGANLHATAGPGKVCR